MVAFLVALALGVLLARSIVEPIAALSSATDRLAAGDLLARVQLSTNDELGRLAAGFNEMANAIQAGRENLTGRVRERTIELERANDELRAQKEELSAQGQELYAQQRELEVKNREVERADRLKSEFLANMSHELRTPLNSIIGFSELLQEETRGELIPRHAQYLSDVQASGRHLLHLINDILDLSKIEAGQMTLTAESVDPASAIAEACGLVQAPAKKKRITLQEEVVSGRPVHADAGKLRQVLLNLLSNAVKFSSEGSSVLVRVEDFHSFVQFEVRDHGPGIDEKLMPRLFQPFVQGENPMTKQHEGTGLGLAICKRLIEQHGGSISVENVEGGGAAFRFTLPAADARSVAPPAGAAAGRAKVLVIEADPVKAQAFREELESVGYDVETVRHGEGAREAVQRVRPTAIVLDPVAEGEDGLRVLDGLKRDLTTSSIPVILTPALSIVSVWPTPIEGSALLERLERFGEPSRPRRVLVIDDDPRVGSLVRSIVEPKGFAIVAATSAHEGLAIAQRDPPDVIILDLIMPEMSGFEVIEALHADDRTRACPVIVLTASDVSDSDRVRLKQHARALAEKGSLTRAELLAAVERATAPVSPQPSAVDAGTTILVVDDNDLNRELARSILERKGYRVLLAEDGDTAIGAALRERPSLILMDLAMPRKDGFAASQELKRNPATAKIPIIALTALAMRGDEERAYAAGLDGYLTKPINRSELEETVARFLRRKST